MGKEKMATKPPTSRGSYTVSYSWNASCEVKHL